MSPAVVRVLYLIDSLAPGGAERSLAEITPLLVERGVDLHIAVLHDRPGFTDEVVAGGATVHSLAGRGGRLGWLLRAARLIGQVRPDVVHTTLFDADLVGRVAARARGVPVVSSLVNMQYGEDQWQEPGVARWKLRIARRLDLSTARLVTRFHAVSETVADAMAVQMRIPRQRIVVVWRGRNPERLGRRSPERRAAGRGRLGVGEDEVVVLAVARHEPQKALNRLVDALPLVRDRVPAARLVVAGREGRETANLRAQIARLGLEDGVMLLGPRDDVADLLCAADVFVLPSVREGLPGAVIEAMALEAPIVASDLPTVREVVGDERAAVLVADPDPQHLADAIVDTLQRPGREERVAAAYQRFVDNFTIAAAAEGMAAFYGEFGR